MSRENVAQLEDDTLSSSEFRQTAEHADKSLTPPGSIARETTSHVPLSNGSAHANGSDLARNASLSDDNDQQARRDSTVWNHEDRVATRRRHSVVDESDNHRRVSTYINSARRRSLYVDEAAARSKSTYAYDDSARRNSTYSLTGRASTERRLSMTTTDEFDQELGNLPSHYTIAKSVSLHVSFSPSFIVYYYYYYYYL